MTDFRVTVDADDVVILYTHRGRKHRRVVRNLDDYLDFFDRWRGPVNISPSYSLIEPYHYTKSRRVFALARAIRQGHQRRAA
jgi:hypothetical protein